MCCNEQLIANRYAPPDRWLIRPSLLCVCVCVCLSCCVSTLCPVLGDPITRDYLCNLIYCSIVTMCTLMGHTMKITTSNGAVASTSEVHSKWLLLTSRSHARAKKEDARTAPITVCILWFRFFSIYTFPLKSESHLCLSIKYIVACIALCCFNAFLIESIQSRLINRFLAKLSAYSTLRICICPNRPFGLL